MKWSEATQRALMDQAFKGAVPTGIFSIIASCLFLFALWDEIPTVHLVSWFLLMVLFQLGRIGFYYYRNKNVDLYPSEYWKTWLFIIVSPGAIFWGILPAITFYEVNDITKLIISIFLAIGPTSQLLNLAAVFHAWLFSMLFLITPMCLTWMFFGVPGIVLGAIGFVYMGYLYAVGKKFNQLMGDRMQYADDAKAAIKAKTSFLATASHDLRQPLHAISMALAAAKAHIKPKAATHTDYKDALISLDTDVLSTENLSRLFNALLDVSKLESGVIKPKISPVPINNLFDYMERTFKPLAVEKGLEFKIVASSLTVDSDPICLQRIVGNMVSNAVQHVHEGKILLGCKHMGNNTLRIMVVDTGPGIPPEKFRDIFQEFQQIDNPGRIGNAGQGLGLAIADKLSNLLNHKLSVNSLPGMGSTFGVDLPISQMQKQLEAYCAPVEMTNQRSPLIALFDPEHQKLEEMAEILRGWGYRVLAFHSYEDAQNLQIRPHIIIASEMFPSEVSGFNVVSLLRSAWHSDAPAIVSVSDLSPQILIEATQQSCKLIHSPVKPDELKLMIESELV